MSMNLGGHRSILLKCPIHGQNHDVDSSGFMVVLVESRLTYELLTSRVHVSRVEICARLAQGCETETERENGNMSKGLRLGRLAGEERRLPIGGGSTGKGTVEAAVSPLEDLASHYTRFLFRPRTLNNRGSSLLLRSPPSRPFRKKKWHRAS